MKNDIKRYKCYHCNLEFDDTKAFKEYTPICEKCGSVLQISLFAYLNDQKNIMSRRTKI